jgi:hypothetical protein
MNVNLFTKEFYLYRSSPVNKNNYVFDNYE